MAMWTIIQTKHYDDEYDIDDGIILNKDELMNDDGIELSTTEIREIILEAL